jgi:hypothetical protein
MERVRSGAVRLVEQTWTLRWSSVPRTLLVELAATGLAQDFNTSPVLYVSAKAACCKSPYFVLRSSVAAGDEYGGGGQNGGWPGQEDQHGHSGGEQAGARVQDRDLVGGERQGKPTPAVRQRRERRQRIAQGASAARSRRTAFTSTSTSSRAARPMKPPG